MRLGARTFGALAATVLRLAAQTPPAIELAAPCADLRRAAEAAPPGLPAALAWIDYAYCCWDAAADAARADAGLAAIDAALAHCAAAPPIARAHLRHARGQMLREAGRTAAAHDELAAALPVLAEAGDAGSLAVCRANLAAVWRDCGELALERDELEQAVRLARAAGSEYLPAVLDSLARLQLALGDHAAALAALDEAAPLRAEPLDALLADVARAEVLFARSRTAAHADDAAQAEALLRAAIARGDRERRWQSQPQRSRILHHLVACLHRRGALQEALQLSTEVMAGLGDGPVAADARLLFSHGSLLASAGQIDVARDWMLRALAAAAARVTQACASGSERAVAIHHAELRNLLSSVLSCRTAARHDPRWDAEDLAAWLCSRGLSEWRHRRARRLATLARTDPALATRLAALRGTTMAPARGDDAAGALARLQQDRWQRELSTAAAVAPARLPPDLDEIARLLPADSVLLVSAHYLHAAMAREGAPTPAPVPSIAVFTLSPQGAARRFDLGAAAVVEDAVTGERRAVCNNLPVRTRGRDPDGAAVPAAPTLLGALLAPVLRTLADDVRRLVVCPDGALAAAPWSAIALPDGGRLGDRFAVSYVDHPWTLGQSPAPAGAASLLVVGAVDYGAAAADQRPRYEPLQFSAPEIDAVTETFATVFPDAAPMVLRGSSATWERFAAAAAGRRFLHLSTHGFVLPPAPVPADTGVPAAPLLDTDPLQATGIALAGANADAASGTVSARQITGLDLTACDLAVLACCDSNVGARAFGEAMAGLTAAVRGAGARAVVGTLWPIPDAAAATFVRRFYDALWREGLAPDAALTAAQRHARAAGLPPAAWAAFVHYGPLSQP
jgi:CHAT domain-containing protein/tetratricopeptide (TPR) repeat protein